MGNKLVKFGKEECEHGDLEATCSRLETEGAKVVAIIPGTSKFGAVGILYKREIPTPYNFVTPKWGSKYVDVYLCPMGDPSVEIFKLIELYSCVGFSCDGETRFEKVDRAFLPYVRFERKE